MHQNLRPAVDLALQQDVVPVLRASGFTGTLPHFRRRRREHIDLLTFQFDRGGGGFIIEIGRCGPTGVRTYFGEDVPANKVTAHDLHPDKRHRIQAAPGSGTDSWFRYDRDGVPGCIAQALAKLPEAEAWWAACV